MQRYLYIFFITITINLLAQYPPPAGQAGSTAIHVDSSLFVDWASGCALSRSFINIADTSLGMVTYGIEQDALGEADNIVVSLGDGGSAIITFNFAIFNGPGPDFAIFENAFLDDYLELAHVEVSSDGINYYRFPSTSLTDTSIQVATYGLIDATKIHNLAGKYRAYYGTPFDLQELAGIPQLDINNISNIKIIDVVGSIDDQYATRDADNKIINDPWPTGFESGGFDLDAVGVINSKCNSVQSSLNKDLQIFPIPVKDVLNIKSIHKISKILLFDNTGKQVAENLLSKNYIDLSEFSSGIYHIHIICDKDIFIKKLIKLK